MITINQQSENKQIFLELLQENVNREGMTELIDFLKKSDFFEAPCSTKFHLACKGGLCQHSLNVYQALINLYTAFAPIDINLYIESLTIVALLHDLCKVNFYKPCIKPVKENGRWVDKPGYEIEDNLPLGHGEKSLYIISKYIKLTTEEALAIRWHMGAFDNAFKGGELAFNTALENNILTTMLQCADMIASKVTEKGQ